VTNPRLLATTEKLEGYRSELAQLRMQLEQRQHDADAMQEVLNVAESEGGGLSERLRGAVHRARVQLDHWTNLRPTLEAAIAAAGLGVHEAEAELRAIQEEG
jgi:predicted nuclease with TOPRIM domain